MLLAQIGVASHEALALFAPTGDDQRLGQVVGGPEVLGVGRQRVAEGLRGGFRRVALLVQETELEVGGGRKPFRGDLEGSLRVFVVS